MSSILALNSSTTTTNSHHQFLAPTSFPFNPSQNHNPHLHSAYSMPTMFPHSLIQQVTFAATTAASSASPSSTASSPHQQQQIGQGTTVAGSVAETKPSAAELLAQAQLEGVLQLGGIGGGGGDQSPQQMLAANNGNGREPKPFKCPQCPKAFANNSYLSQHMRIHLGIRAFGPCQYCGKKFTQLSHLQQHIRTHTGEKPYKCKFANCEKAFSQLSNLQSHSRCHQDDRPFKCNSCYKCFADEQTLLEHIPRHKESKHLKASAKVHICPFCGKSYSQALYLDKHMTKHTDRRGGTDMRFMAKDYYTNGTSTATMAAGNLMNGTTATTAGLLLDGFDNTFDGLVGTHLGQLGQHQLQQTNGNGNNNNNNNNNGTDTLKHFMLQHRQPTTNNNNNSAASAAVTAAALSSAAAAGYGAATIGGYAGMTGTSGSGGLVATTTTASGAICNPFGTAIANSGGGDRGAMATANVQMAFGNSAAFNLFHSFQQHQQQQQQQQQNGGTIGGTARGFNMITPLENIKHFNSSQQQQSGGQTANFH